VERWNLKVALRAYFSRMGVQGSRLNPRQQLAAFSGCEESFELSHNS
jgi:hypothetical protein